MYYLYVKTHVKTGLKYLGQTSKDPYTYLGSGKRWLNHLRKHGNDITTEILLETTDINQIKEQGIYYSRLWNIVEDSRWANLTEEQGTGGAINKGRSHTLESIEKIRQAKIGKSFSEEHRRNLSKSHKGKNTKEDNGFYGRSHSDESKMKMSASLSGKVRSEEFKQRLSEYWKGKPKGPMSEDTKRKIRETKRRNKDDRTGM